MGNIIFEKPGQVRFSLVLLTPRTHVLFVSVLRGLDCCWNDAKNSVALVAILCENMTGRGTVRRLRVVADLRFTGV
jgi:hypothetical protein